MYLFGWERDQLLFLPEAVDDCVGSKNPVRCVDAFVDGLDLVKRAFAQVEATGSRRVTRRQHAHSAVMIFHPARDDAVVVESSTGRATLRMF